MLSRMKATVLEVLDPDGVRTILTCWHPDGPRVGVVQILHGWAEHRGRYERVAGALTSAGYSVYADDHRGHGETGIKGGGLGDLGPRGMDGVLDAVRAVTELIRRESPRLPLFLLGHSWGSFLAQHYLRRWAADLDGALLTGTTYRDPDAPPPASAATAATAVSAPAPPGAPPAPTLAAYAWLTRDTAEVQKYIDDPWCGFERMATPRPRGSSTAGAGAGAGAGAVAHAPIPTTLPILVFNGAEDRVGGEAGGRRLAEHYRALGLTDVEFGAYPGARHELFNETNRDEVVADVLAWLRARTSR